MTFKFFIAPLELPEDLHLKWPFNVRYQFGSIALAEGFEDLNLQFSGTVNYWYIPDEKRYLITKKEEPADVCIYDVEYFLVYPQEVDNIDTTRINVLVDNEDGFVTAALEDRFSKFNLILRSHYSSSLPYGKNVRPWAFALSNRVIKGFDKYHNEAIKDRVMISYRVNHDVREITNRLYIPLLAERFEIFQFESKIPSKEEQQDPTSYWVQTGRRHDDNYFRELNSSLLGLTFGGSFATKPYPAGLPSKVVNLFNRALLKVIPGIREIGALQYIFQFDSWRLWETFISNACPISVQFEDWNAVLPVMPVAFKHYIPVDLGDIKGSAGRLLSMSDVEIKTIGQEGRKWAMQNYSPKAMANRLLQHINEL